MADIYEKNSCLYFKSKGETLFIEPWNNDSFRIRAVLGDSFRTDEKIPQALLEKQDETAPVIRVEQDYGLISNGKLEARILRNVDKDEKSDDHNGQIVFTNLQTGKVILKEYLFQTKFHETSRELFQREEGLFEISQSFKSDRTEKLYGMGQHHNGMLNQKGCMVEMRQRNRDITVPFVVSSYGYGMLWNVPGTGRFTSSMEQTRWEAYGAYQLDYWVTTAETPAAILMNYMKATGTPGKFPHWATGFWQCKLRYLNQDELLDVAREYKKRGLPISVIVIDYFHWSAQGDWDFDKEAWPDPDAMMKELEEMGIKVMISVWPTVSTYSRNYNELNERGLLVRGRSGNPALFPFYEVGKDGDQWVHYYDAMNKAGRDFIWKEVKENYYDRGIDIYWLDACEPESIYGKTEEFMFDNGPGIAVANVYPLLHEQGFYENMKEAGTEEVVNLCRSAWAGSQRYGAAVWSGDIPSTFGSFRRQIRSGLNMVMSGIPWWTTDIGGFTGGEIDDPGFQELIARWFAYGAFCPIFRLHGVRKSENNAMGLGSGAENEVWSFGEENYEILTMYMKLREVMRPYIQKQFDKCTLDGTPIMRPLLYDFPTDENCWEVDDQFMFGGDYLIAPIDRKGIRDREVYLPAGEDWINAWTGENFKGGRSYTVPAPIAEIPFFVRKGASNPLENLD